MNRRSGPLLLTAALALVAVGVYANALDNTAFFHQDRDPYVEPVLDNTILHSTELLPLVFTKQFLLATHGHYRPVGYAAFALTAQLMPEGSYWGWHALLLVLHLATGLVIFLAARGLLDDIPAAALAGVYLVHPALSLFLNDLNLVYCAWGLLFSALTLWLFLVYLRTRALPAILGSIAMFGLAVFAYPGGVVLPALLLAACLFYETYPRATAAALVYLSLGAAVAGLLGVPTLITLVGFAFLLVLTAVAVSLPRRRYLAAAQLMAPCAIVLGVYFGVSATMEANEVTKATMLALRRLELAHVWQPGFLSLQMLGASGWYAISLLIAAAVPAFFLSGWVPRAGAAAAVVVLAGMTAYANTKYQDDVTWWRYVDEGNREQFAVDFNLATAYLNHGQWEQGRDRLMHLGYETSLSRLQTMAVQSKLGTAYAGMGRDKIAGYFFFSVMKTTKWYYMVMKNLLKEAADFYFEAGYFSSAEFCWASGLVIDRYDAELYNNLGRVLVCRNFFRAAARYFERVLSWIPDDDTALYYRAFVARVRGNEAAYRHYSSRWQAATGSGEEIDFEPIYAGYSFDREQMVAWFSDRAAPLLTNWQMVGEAVEKRSYIAKYDGKTYNFWEVPLEIGKYLEGKGKLRRAVDYLKVAHLDRPEATEVRQLLADCYRRLGEPQKANRLLERSADAENAD